MTDCVRRRCVRGSGSEAAPAPSAATGATRRLPCAIGKVTCPSSSVNPPVYRARSTRGRTAGAVTGTRGSTPKDSRSSSAVSLACTPAPVVPLVSTATAPCWSGPGARDEWAPALAPVWLTPTWPAPFRMVQPRPIWSWPRPQGMIAWGVCVAATIAPMLQTQRTERLSTCAGSSPWAYPWPAHPPICPGSGSSASADSRFPRCEPHR